MIKMGIDLGSNRIKYSIVDTQSMKVLDSKSDYYKMLMSLDSNGNIPDEKVNEVIDIINRYIENGRKYNVTSIRAVGTAGLRKPNNSNELIDKVKEATNVTIEIISGAEEARLNWKGALLSFDNNNATYIVIDLGGGSCEFAVGTKDAPQKVRSIDIGTSTFTSKFDTFTRNIADEELPGMKHYIISKLYSINIPYADHNIYVLTGSSGIVILQASNPDLIGPENKWNRKPLWELPKDMVIDAYKKYQHDKTCDDTTLCFAQTFIISTIMERLQIPSIYYSTTTLKEGIALA